MEKKRIQTSILSKIEKKFIDFMLPKFPNWVTPDVLTFLAFFAGLLMPVFYYLARFNKIFLFFVSLLLVVHWFGDSHDGGLARYRKITRPKYGYYIDHVLDSIIVFFGCLGLLIYGLDSLLVLLIFACYSILFLHSIVYSSITKEFRISFFRFSPTEARLLVIIMNLFLFFGFKRYVEVFLYFFIAIAILVIIYSISTTAIKLNKADKKMKVKQ